jgi:hypothetical protein
MLADEHTDAITFELVYNYWYDVSIIGSQKLHSTSHHQHRAITKNNNPSKNKLIRAICLNIMFLDKSIISIFGDRD